MPFMGLSDEQRSYLDSEATNGAVKTDLNENAEAGFDAAVKNMGFASRARSMNREFDTVWDENAKKIAALGGTVPNRIELFDAKKDIQETGGVFGGDYVLQKHKEAIDELKKKDPSILSLDEMEAETTKRAIAASIEARATQAEISARAGLGGDVGGFIGMAAGVMTDPLNIGLMAATAPIALEGLGTAILGNAAIGAGSEAAAQFLPGGVRDWSREQGLSPEEVNRETMMAVGGAGVGGGVIGGVLHGGGKALGAIGEKVFSKEPLKARAAVDELLEPKNAGSLAPQAVDQLNVIQAAQKMEDTAAFNVLNTKYNHVDGEAILRNLEAYNEIAKSIVDDAYTPKVGTFTNETVDILRQRVNQADIIGMEINGGIGGQELDDLMKTFLTEDRYTRFRELVDEYKGDGNRLGGLSKAEEIIKDAQARMPGEGVAPADLVAQAEKMRSLKDQKAKDVADLKSILDEADAKKAKLEKDIVAMHEGKWGQLDDMSKNQIHDDLMGQIKKLEADRASFAKEHELASKELADITKKADKAERRASQDAIANREKAKADQASEIERDTANDLEINREEANLASKPEINAAKEVLQEMKLIEQNKIAYAELFAKNPTGDISELRKIVSVMELRNRMNEGDAVHVDDFLDMLNPEERTTFNKMLSDSNDLGQAADDFIKSVTAKVDADGVAHIERVAKSINETLERFGEKLQASDLLEAAKRAATAKSVNHTLVAKQLKDLVNGTEYQKTVDAFLENNINTKVTDPDTGLEMSISDFLQSAKKEQDIIDIIQACKV